MEKMKADDFLEFLESLGYKKVGSKRIEPYDYEVICEEDDEVIGVDPVEDEEDVEE